MTLARFNRNAAIAYCHLGGFGARAIAEATGLSKQRVHYILRRAGARRRTATERRPRQPQRGHRL